MLQSEDVPLPKGFSDIDDVISGLEEDPRIAADLVRGRQELLAILPAGSLRGLAAIRLEKGFSQKQLAEAIGTKQPQVSRIEAGHCDPQLSTLKKIADALNVSLDKVASAVLETCDARR